MTDATESAEQHLTLGEALPKEMARVRDELIPAYQEIGLAGRFGIIQFQRLLDEAAQAMIKGDVVEMLRVYTALKGCE